MIRVISFHIETRGAYLRLAATMALVPLMRSEPLAAQSPEWTGIANYRILLEVDPLDIAPRTEDELVARHAIDFSTLLAGAGVAGEVDLSTLQVQRYDPSTNLAEPFRPFDNAVSEYDRPCRFDDDAIPDNYPGRVGAASDQPNGKPPVTIRPRKGRLFNRAMNNDSGHLVWVHTQVGTLPSYYAVYFGLAGGSGTGSSPSPWIGDVDVYRLATGQSLGGLAHFTQATGDLNGDGLFDLVAGVEKGDLMFFPNKGTPDNPSFTGCEMVMDELGPVDLGWYAAPYVYDWNDDGLLDLLVGTNHNVIVWWKNTGSTTNPAFVYQGFVRADGARLSVPESPVPEDISGSFGVDYFNQPWIGDWNSDGLPDLLTGGYTTGRIFYYRCTGRDGAGVPILTYEGPVEADGQPIDTGWAASPTAHDIDNDGKLELITGSWNFAGASPTVEYLMYYKNIGTVQAPYYSRMTFPKSGGFPSSTIARASVADWNNDGKSDLVVSDVSGAVYRFLNVGSANNPTFQANSNGLTGDWGFVPMVPIMSIHDWDNNGQQELLAGATIYALEGSVHSPHLVTRGTARINGQALFNPGPGYGDEFNWNVFWDWDLDGKVDILSGIHQGNVMFHKNLGAADNLSFAPGVKLSLTNGQDLKIGPPVYVDPEDVPDFTELQGSRMRIVPCDFDGDGIDDLVLTETYNNIWLFRNTVAGGLNTLSPGVVLTTTPGRTELTAFDWDSDERIDLVSGLTITEPGTVYPNLSSPGSPALGGAIQPFGLPYVFWGAIFYGTDWNADGDRDFLIRSEFYTFWAERSFIDHGYVSAQAVSATPIVWQATFDTDAEGVEYIYESTARSMIGPVTNGKLEMTVVNAAESADFNRAGRPFGSTLTAQDAFTGSCRFNWSQLYEGDIVTGWGSVQFVGFLGEHTGVGGDPMYRQLLGTLFQQYKQAGRYYVKLTPLVATASDLDVTTADWIDLGTDPFSQTYELVFDYDGGAYQLDIELLNDSGGLLGSASGQIDTMAGGVASLSTLSLTHLGWSDYRGAIGQWTETDIVYTWHVDEMSFLGPPATAIEVPIGGACCLSDEVCEQLSQSECVAQFGLFQGDGSHCLEVSCEGACPDPSADADHDLDVDLSDYGLFQRCFTGANDPQDFFDATSCRCFDLDNAGIGDGDIDAEDLAGFTACLSGSGTPADPACDD